MKRILCWLGWHEWRFVGREWIGLSAGHPLFRCKHCPKIKWGNE